MKVYVVIHYEYEDCTHLEDVFSSEEDARSYILINSDEPGFRLSDGEWRYTSNEAWSYYCPFGVRGYSTCLKRSYYEREVR